MTTTPINQIPASERVVPPGRYGLRGALGSEWTKLLSVRSTVWTLLVTTVLGIGLGAIVTSAQASRFSARGPLGQDAFDPTRASLAGLLAAQLAIGVLGVLLVSSEYSTGTIRATLSAVPRRWMVLLSKVGIFGAVVIVVGEAVSVVAFLVGQAILQGKTPTASFSDPTVVRAVLSGGLFLLVLGLFAMGLATIIRNTAGAISAYVGALFITPIIANLLPSSYSSDVGRFLPETIGTVMFSAHYQGSDPWGPWPSFLLLAGYAVLALVIGGIVLTKRDA
ncbi:MAG: ABC transporter permease subunit [Acidimicrobiales bacterium]